MNSRPPAVAEAVDLIAKGDIVRGIILLRDSYDALGQEAFVVSIGAEGTVAWEFDTEEWLGFAQAVEVCDSIFNLAVAFWRLDGCEDLALKVLRIAVDAGSKDAAKAMPDWLLWLNRGGEAEKALAIFSDDEIRQSPRLSGLLGTLRHDHQNLADDLTRELLIASLVESDEFKFTLAQLAMERGEWTYARQLLVELVEVGDGRAPIVLGNLLQYQFDDFVGAESAYRRGIELDDSFSSYNLGLMLLSLGRNDEEIELISNAADAGDVVAQRRLATLKRDG